MVLLQRRISIDIAFGPNDRHEPSDPQYPSSCSCEHSTLPSPFRPTRRSKARPCKTTGRQRWRAESPRVSRCPARCSALHRNRCHPPQRTEAPRSAATAGRHCSPPGRTGPRRRSRSPPTAYCPRRQRKTRALLRGRLRRTGSGSESRPIRVARRWKDRCHRAGPGIRRYPSSAATGSGCPDSIPESRLPTGSPRPAAPTGRSRTRASAFRAKRLEGRSEQCSIFAPLHPPNPAPRPAPPDTRPQRCRKIWSTMTFYALFAVPIKVFIVLCPPQFNAVSRFSRTPR